MAGSTPVRCLIFVHFLRNFNAIEERSFEEWSSILHLSTRWGFTSIRDLAIRCAKPPSPLHQLLLARKYAIEQWINPAFLGLCERPEPLNLDEARVMDFEDVVLVGSIRQTIRSPALKVKGAEIRDCIQAWKSGEPWRPASDTPVACPIDSRTPSPPPNEPVMAPSRNPFGFGSIPGNTQAFSGSFTGNKSKGKKK